MGVSVWFLFVLVGFVSKKPKVQPTAVFTAQALQNWTSLREPESEADSKARASEAVSCQSAS